MNDASQTIVLRADRSVVLSRVALVFLVAIGSAPVWIVVLPQLWKIASALTVLLVLYLSRRILGLLVNPDAIVLSPTGLFDRAGGLGFVAWENIRGVKIRTTQGCEVIELDLNDVNAVLANMSAVDRWLLENAMASDIVGPHLGGSWIPGGTSAVFAAIVDRINRRDHSGAGDLAR